MCRVLNTTSLLLQIQSSDVTDDKLYLAIVLLLKETVFLFFWPNWYCTCKWTLFHSHHCLQKYDQSNYCLDDGGQVLCSFLCLEEGYELWMCLTLLILFERSLDFTIYIAYIIWGIIVGALLLAVLYPAFIFHPLYSDISMEKERGVCSM